MSDSNEQAEAQMSPEELAQVQARAGDIVLASPSINRVRWELDENWYHLQFMKSQQNSAF